ncbi:MAG: ATP-binding protein [Solirubrobacteraceae bacterium]
MQSDANTLTITYPAEHDSVARARHVLSEFAATAGADGNQVDAVRLAVSEAVTNAVLHAYRGEAGNVHVTAAVVAEDELWILIGDDGCGLESRPDRPGLGLGLALISQLSDELAVVPRASGGIEVRMRFALVNAPSARVGGAGRARAAGPRALDGLLPDGWLGCRTPGRARRPA